MSAPTGAQTATPSAIIVADLWNLQAAPASIEEVAVAWRSLATAAASSREAVVTAARSVLQDWEGDDADAYHEHRRKFTADLADLAEAATAAADALDAMAGVLRSGQELLHQQLTTLTTTVPGSRQDDQVVFSPADAAQATMVTDAIAAANETRSWVDEELVMKEGSLGRIQGDFQELSDVWTADTVRVMNLNIGQGHGNAPGDERGTDQGDVPDIADIIDENGADVVTLQEVFGGDLDTLEDELEARTGDEWNVHFAKASDKVQVSTDDSSGTHFGPVHLPDFTPDIPTIVPGQDFGNAVLVREGSGIESSELVDNVKLDVPGSRIDSSTGEAAVVPPHQPPTGTTTTIPPGDLPETIEDGEGRSAAHVRVTFEEP